MQPAMLRRQFGLLSSSSDSVCMRAWRKKSTKSLFCIFYWESRIRTFLAGVFNLWWKTCHCAFSGIPHLLSSPCNAMGKSCCKVSLLHSACFIQNLEASKITSTCHCAIFGGIPTFSQFLTMGKLCWFHRILWHFGTLAASKADSLMKFDFWAISGAWVALKILLCICICPHRIVCHVFPWVALPLKTSLSPSESKHWWSGYICGVLHI